MVAHGHVQGRSCIPSQGRNVLRTPACLIAATALSFAALWADTNAAVAQTGGPTWTQVGQDIDGETFFDLSGDGVAMSTDGTTVIIGATDNENDSGHARIYQLDAATNTWQQVGQDIDGENVNDLSGESVAMSADGNTVIIGARGNDDNGTGSGHARIYQLDAATNTWQQVGQDIDGENAFDLSGWSVSMSDDGNTVIIGATDNDGSGDSSGHARIYQLDAATNTWQQVGQDIDGENAFDGSGRAVAMSADGNTVIVGAPDNDGNGPRSGHARIFQLDTTTNTWLQLGQDLDGEHAADRSGWSVSMSDDGNTVIVGARANGDNGSSSGHARVYDFDGTTWQQVGQDIDGENAFDNSGESVSMTADGNTVIIGAPFNNGNGSAAGHARIYQLDSATNNWQQVGQDIDGETVNNSSGFAVAMSSAGDTVIIGAPFNDDSGIAAGHARVYEFLIPSPQTCNGLVVTVDLAAGQSPTAGDDVIVGTTGADVIAALTGNDTICSLDGDDIITGGPGNDFVDAGPGNDEVFGFDGDDIINGLDGDDIILGGNGNDTIAGSDGADRLNGGLGNDTITGGLGNDTMFGQAGDDMIDGNDGYDLIVGAAGVDIINGGTGNDVLNGGADDDTVDGGPGNDTIFGLAGDDVLNGGLDNDMIFGQLGNDTIDGNDGDDLLLGNNGNDILTDPSGINTLNGGAGNDTLSGGIGTDQVFGDANPSQAGDDIIEGGPGNDLLVGFAGDDTIIADDGVADTVNGGPHTAGDTCTTDGQDTVFNCNP